MFNESQVLRCHVVPKGCISWFPGYSLMMIHAPGSAMSQCTLRHSNYKHMVGHNWFPLQSYVHVHQLTGRSIGSPSHESWHHNFVRTRNNTNTSNAAPWPQWWSSCIKWYHTNALAIIRALHNHRANQFKHTFTFVSSSCWQSTIGHHKSHDARFCFLQVMCMPILWLHLHPHVEMLVD